MDQPLSLLVVDVSEDWEELLKAHERGFFIDWEPVMPGCYQVSRLSVGEVPLEISYPHGSVRAGFNAIIDTVRIAAASGIPIYAVHLYDGWSDGEEQTCHSLQPYIPKGNQYEKRSFSAFNEQYCDLAKRLRTDGVEHLMVVGYDRDDCVLETVKDAVSRGITVVASEHCMLTADRYDRRQESLAYYRQHTVFLESLVDVWNFLWREGRR